MSWVGPSECLLGVCVWVTSVDLVAHAWGDREVLHAPQTWASSCPNRLVNHLCCLAGKWKGGQQWQGARHQRHVQRCPSPEKEMFLELLGRCVGISKAFPVLILLVAVDLECS